jgi:hypothetical protein
VASGDTLVVAGSGALSQSTGAELDVGGVLSVQRSIATAGNIQVTGHLSMDSSLTVSAGDTLLLGSGATLTQALTPRAQLSIDGVLDLKAELATTGSMTLSGQLLLDSMLTVSSGDTLTIETGAEVVVGVAGGLSVAGTVTHVIALDSISTSQGHEISWPVNTSNDSIAAITRCIGPDGSDVLVKVSGFETTAINPNGGTGATLYDPELPEFINTLKLTDHRLYYEIWVSDNDTLAVSGALVSPSTEIELVDGWNAVSYLDYQSSTPAVVFADLGSFVRADTYESSINNPSGSPYGEKRYIDGSSTHISDRILTMAPHLGYWIKMDEADTLVYSSKLSSGTVPPTRRFIFAYGTLTVDGDPAPVGTRVTVRHESDGLVGTFTVWTEGWYGAVPIYLDDSVPRGDEDPHAGKVFTLEVDGVPVGLDPQQRLTWRCHADVARVDVSVGPGGSRKAASGNPTEFRLEAAYPNPSNPSTTIRYQLPEARRVELSVYNLQGQVVRRLVDEEQQGGFYSVVWDGRTADGRAAASGTYLYRMKAGPFSDCGRVLLLK